LSSVSLAEGQGEGFLKWAASNKAETDLTHPRKGDLPCEVINIPLGKEDKRLTPLSPPNSCWTGFY